MTEPNPTAKDGLRFDWYQPLEADFVDDLADKVIATIEDSRTSTRGFSKEKVVERKQTQLTIAKHLLSALYNAHHSISNKKTPTRVSVIKTTSKFSGTKRDSDKIPYSYDYFIAVYNVFISLKWIKENLGKETDGYTRIYAINELKATFEKVGLNWFKQSLRPREDLIVLRDRVETKPKEARHTSAPKKYKKITMVTPDTPEVAQMADNLYRYNDFLTKHCVSLSLPDNDLYEIAKSLYPQSTGVI